MTAPTSAPTPAATPAPAQAPQTPAWLDALTGGLVEALPRLHGCPPDPAIEATLAAMAHLLAAGELELVLPDPQQREQLAASPLCSGPWSPLVLEGDRLLWRRWFQQREAVLEALCQRAGPARWQPCGLEEARQRAAAQGEGLDADQRGAVAAALHYGLVLLQGGPGTGKTSTVARMLAALRAHAPAARMQLAAPTGKAAARLRAALAGARGGSAMACSTLHRLLESQGERFGRHRHHPLDLDLLVIDEVSMVDLELMGAVLEALPSSCRLVLVGDAAQLPPVRPGAVLLELQTPRRREALGGAVVELHTTYRNNGAIAQVADQLRWQGAAAADAEPSGSWRALCPTLERLPATANLHWLPASPLHLPPALLERLRRHQRALQRQAQALESGDHAAARALLKQLDALLVLSPARRGRWGVEAVHRALLGEALEQPIQAWPAGTPVLCQRNLPAPGLANGDVGIVVDAAGTAGASHGQASAGRRLLFAPGGGSELLWLHPAQLPDPQPALALTVHKAQGSEAEEVWVLIPDSGRPTDRLLYTALTRARQQAHLITPPP
ncbi:ATP-dependent RecD-like DNA helicase [Cyanobium sp. NIES-981]|uniref:ATP-dependent DNA helicase n=1 Tax=Cyanobium sp. NIES-981 TaxID=1851505 RepID=UPI0007DD529E|nr:AAA family ATPase [Cyanobium sp. NIES-981]SBO42870.1 Exodeoxyribonuclease V, alpha subunit [Cyanobium sp. NIES-981]